MDEKRSPNIQDVADLAHVSISTVSRVVNDSGYPIRAETRRRVIEAVEALGFRPSPIARSLVGKPTLTIGLMASLFVALVFNPTICTVWAGRSPKPRQGNHWFMRGYRHFLEVGLGNPGAQYEATRHNAGFWWVDEFARSCGASFRPESKFHGLFARVAAHGREVMLLKPQTFMNVSGRAVGAVAQFYKIAPAQILVVHDELDLPPGSAKLKLGGGHGGHNGLKDIIAHLGTKDFWRLRIGIGHPGERNDVSNFVLNPPRKEERILIEEAMRRAQEVAALVVEGKMEAAMLKLHSN